MGNKFEVTTPVKRFENCVCTSDAWTHIVNNHQIMGDNETAIINALEKPLCVYISDEYGNRAVFFGKTLEATYKENFLTKVVVEQPCSEEENCSYVISAWPQKDIKGNLKEGGLLYVDRRLGR